MNDESRYGHSWTRTTVRKHRGGGGRVLHDRWRYALFQPVSAGPSSG